MGQSTSQESEHNSAIRAIEQQQHSLKDKMSEHGSNAVNLLADANASLQHGYRQQAVQQMRQRQQMLQQVATIQGILLNLDAHKHALETKLITTATMNVMRRTAETLAKHHASIDSVDTMMMDSDDIQSEVMNIGRSMGTSSSASTDDELLLMLTGAPETGMAVHDVLAAPPGTKQSSDTDFLQYVEARLLQLKLPKVPPDFALAVPVFAAPPDYERIAPLMM